MPSRPLAQSPSEGTSGCVGSGCREVFSLRVCRVGPPKRDPDKQGLRSPTQSSGWREQRGSSAGVDRDASFLLFQSYKAVPYLSKERGEDE